MGLFGFGKKADKPYRVMHYEGIDSVASNMPCTFMIKDDVINIDFTSGMNVTLPTNRVIRFEAMKENEFLTKYKGTNASESNFKNNTGVSFLVVTYTAKDNQEKRIVLWAANIREVMYFTDLQYKYKPATGNIEL